MNSRTLGLVVLAALANVSLVACTAGTDSSTPSAPASPIGRIRLQGLTVDQPTAWKPDGSNWSAEVMWDAPAADIQHYIIRRDGITLADDLEEPSYTDDTISPAERFLYEVVAVDPAGKESKPARVNIRTGAPPLNLAILDGIFSTRLMTGASNNIEVGQRSWKSEFFFNTLCRRPGCGSRWSLVGSGSNGSNVELTPKDRRYEGSGSGRISLQDCYQRPVSGSTTIVVRVTAGQSMGDEWMARRVEGTLREQGDPVSGCLTGSVTWTFTGSLKL